ncbi:MULTISPECIES: MarR family transcriptional regulator [Bacillus cereus group]|uniref:MarR family transcriptional regulator n=1 Tax=Bacillus proteolyticus TaxID=2026192 RepID=A0ABV3II60_9BACI|nr:MULTISPECIES: MarR family transcriptional regulator [Bacillus cereus group]PEY33112.1 MarR family transcriptional regulator [Bacillus cereus]MBJ8107856.1 MarR family transcriptional regulator [Bacillus cereus group sp. N8]MED1559986.1 MarR family transcriptional regulator [Bacillus paramycoides]PFD40286.1 MarR family transcriptional regulator [Bacillus cereus]WJE55452.1 MarR family transcriptional regulator [Bacillus cereus]
MSKVVNFEDAEKKAKVRENKVEDLIGQAQLGLSAEQQQLLLQVLHSTTGEDYFIGKKKKRTDGVKFVQMITENIDYLCEIGYLTQPEKAFLFDISRFLEFKSNVIVEKNDDEVKPNAASPSYLAKKLGKTRTSISKMMNDLLAKGVLGVAETGVTTEDGRTCSSRTWFVNPNVLCNAPKDDVDRATQQIFARALRDIQLEGSKKKHKLPIYLF